MGFFEDAWEAVLPVLLLWLLRLAIVGAIIIVGSKVIRKIQETVRKILTARKMDASIAGFFESLLGFGMRFVLFIVVAGIVGINTNSFIAIIGASVFAISFALQGALSNFAAGVMLLTFKPIRVGEYVTVSGETGWVQVIELFNTQLQTEDGHVVIIPNSLITDSNIVNMTRYGKVRVDMEFTIKATDNLILAKEIILDLLDGDDRVKKEPPCRVVVDMFDHEETVLRALPWVNSDDQIEFRYDTIAKVKAKFDDHGLTGVFEKEFESDLDSGSDSGGSTATSSAHDDRATGAAVVSTADVVADLSTAPSTGAAAVHNRGGSTRASSTAASRTGSRRGSRANGGLTLSSSTSQVDMVEPQSGDLEVKQDIALSTTALQQLLRHKARRKQQ